MNAEQRAEIARVLREKFASSGMTQPDLAAKADVSERAISDFVRGARVPQDETLRSIGRALDYADLGEIRAQWPVDVGVFLDLLGAILATRPEQLRKQLMRDLIALVAQSHPG